MAERNPDPFNKPLEPATRFTFIGDDSDVTISKTGNRLSIAFCIECENADETEKLFDRMETMKQFKLTASGPDK
jgi:hypothetical protein